MNIYNKFENKYNNKIKDLADKLKNNQNKKKDNISNIENKNNKNEKVILKGGKKPILTSDKPNIYAEPKNINDTKLKSKSKSNIKHDKEILKKISDRIKLILNNSNKKSNNKNIFGYFYKWKSKLDKNKRAKIRKDPKIRLRTKIYYDKNYNEGIKQEDNIIDSLIKCAFIPFIEEDKKAILEKRSKRLNIESDNKTDNIQDNKIDIVKSYNKNDNDNVKSYKIESNNKNDNIKSYDRNDNVKSKNKNDNNSYKNEDLSDDLNSHKISEPNDKPLKLKSNKKFILKKGNKKDYDLLSKIYKKIKLQLENKNRTNNNLLGYFTYWKYLSVINDRQKRRKDPKIRLRTKIYYDKNYNEGIKQEDKMVKEILKCAFLPYLKGNKKTKNRVKEELDKKSLLDELGNQLIEYKVEYKNNDDKNKILKSSNKPIKLSDSKETKNVIISNVYNEEPKDTNLKSRPSNQKTYESTKIQSEEPKDTNLKSRPSNQKTYESIQFNSEEPKDTNLKSRPSNKSKNI